MSTAAFSIIKSEHRVVVMPLSRQQRRPAIHPLVWVVVHGVVEPSLGAWSCDAGQWMLCRFGWYVFPVSHGVYCCSFTLYPAVKRLVMGWHQFVFIYSFAALLLNVTNKPLSINRSENKTRGISRSDNIINTVAWETTKQRERIIEIQN